MSLIGNLEDLSLPDILQIISLSRKSGVLGIHRGGEEGKIFLRQGKVIQTDSATSRRNLGMILEEKGLVASAELERVLEEQRRGGMSELFGSVLVSRGLLSHETLEQVVQEQIEETVFYFLTWREGTFKFDLMEVDERLEIGVDPQVLISQKGIDTQWLVLEGTRLLDERQSKGGAASRGTEPLPMGGIPATLPGQVVLVDDDDVFSARFIEVAAARNIAVVRMAGVAQAAEYLATAGKDLFMVVDVVMPTADGRGFLGGLDLAGLVAREHPRARLAVISAYPDDSVVEALREIGQPSPILKPEAGRDGEVPDLASFIDALMGALLPAGQPTGEAPTTVPAPPPLSPPEAGDEISAEGGPAAPHAPSPDELLGSARKDLEEALRGFPAFRLTAEDLVAEVEKVQMASEVGLAILRMASELCERAILFRARLAEAVSLGGFGFEAQAIRLRDGLRNLSVSLVDSPALGRAFEEGKPVSSAEGGFSERDLLTVILGEPLPRSWAVIPSGPSGGAVLLLYVDTGPAGPPLKGETVMSAFLVLAGYHMGRLLQGAAGGPGSKREGAR